MAAYGVILCCLGVALITCRFPLFFALYEQIYPCDILGNAQLESTLQHF
jgi:hypothetical protein